MVKKKRQNEPHDIDDSSTESCDEAKSGNGTNAVGTPSFRESCQHLRKSVDLTKLRKALNASDLKRNCMECNKSNPDGMPSDQDPDEVFEYDKTLWLCLKCGTQLCGRSKNQHALSHYKTPRSDSHALALNTITLEIWCYACDKEVDKSSRKNLQECVDFIKKLSQKAFEENNKEVHKTMYNPFIDTEDDDPCEPPKPPPMPHPPIPGRAQRTTPETIPSSYISATSSVTVPPASFNQVESLPRVRGLTNLGNTCFFNAVLQCLAQTPYLLDILMELSEPGEEFVLPGGTCQFQNGDEKDLPPIKGVLSSWGVLTESLAETLQELQSGGGVYTPHKLLSKLIAKHPQFSGGDQHDSHELLRHLLESVRTEDLHRYQKVILQHVGYKNQNAVCDEIKKKCRMYGAQASDRILRPEQVFRGFLVSTLTCQDCYHTSSRHENFSDVSVPVSVEKPQPPIRRKTSPENSPIMLPGSALSKHQIKKEKEKERKAKRAQKHRSKKQHLFASDGNPIGENTDTNADGNSPDTSSEESDADVEDNLIDEVPKNFIGPLWHDANGNGNNGELVSPTANVNAEKRGDSPENHNKDSNDDENDSGIPASPNDKSEETEALDICSRNVVIEAGLSEKGVNIVRQFTINDPPINGFTAAALTNNPNNLSKSLEKLDIKENKENAENEINNDKKLECRKCSNRRVRTQSYSDWNTTIAPRYQCKDGECSVQSCLNNFTAVELMTGNNKVGCDGCTKRMNGDDEKAKTVYTNATKQYLVSSPPAVLILHLKRFQVEPRGLFRKLTRPVMFPVILDVAPFCGSKVKNLPNIDRKQKKLLYALYGIVEHSGGMFGGHYTAYVKVRPKLSSDDKRWKFLPQGSKAELDQEDEQKAKLEELLVKEKARELRMKANDSDDFTSSSSSSELDYDENEGAVGGIKPKSSIDPSGNADAEPDNIEPPPGKWFYVSDSKVQEVTEAQVLKAQAYLLFYERIF